jgi:ribonuclease HII
MLAASFTGDKVEAGCDEAGRGCLAGPVVAASVILPADYFHPLLNDSKQLTEKERETLKLEIEKEAVSYAVGVVDNHRIDEINILNASYQAMHQAIDQLLCCPEFLLIDGNRYKPHNDTPFECLIKGDGRFFSIAAASVLAKTYRDDFMRTLHKEFPVYGWDQNKGYPTVRHRDAIREHGVTSYHRMSFQLLSPQLTIFEEIP